MKILAILQNQWFKDPARMEKILERQYKGNRPEFIRTFLFWSCLTGKRLKAALGEDLCDRIVWEECSPKMGGCSSAKFDPDPDHLRRVIEEQKPDVIVTFGALARDAVKGLSSVLAIVAPHPAARHATVMQELRAVASQLAQLEAAAAA